MSKPTNKKICEACKNEYEPTGNAQRWCSLTCKHIPEQVNKEKQKLRFKKWKEKNPGYYTTYSQQPIAKQKNWEGRVYRLYGVTVAEYEALVLLQGNVCGICGRPPTTTRLHLDHKHQPKEKQLRKKKEQHKIRPNVRGLLCWRCNTSIAKFRDNPTTLRKAAEYLENPPAKKVIKCQ